MRNIKIAKLEDITTLISYKDAQTVCPWAVNELVAAIRRSKSIHRLAAASSLSWGIAYHQTTPTKIGGRVTHLKEKCLRLVCEIGKLRRISRLYKLDGKLVEGNWTF